MIRPAARWLGGTLMLLILAGCGALVGWRALQRSWSPDPQAIARASLQSMREQNRLVPFTARYVAVVTSIQQRFGMTARKTLIMPGTVRYEVDLGRLRPADLAWDAKTGTLVVALPPVELAGPEIDLAAMREYNGGGMLMALTDAGARLDASNRAAGRAELLAQARAPLPMRLAAEAAARAVEQSFALPLRAAGLDATVRVTVANGRDDEQVDRSRSLAQVYAEGRVR